ncbi:D-alanyl-D-alanine carboxypeptidase [Amorphus suaedae]
MTWKIETGGPGRLMRAGALAAMLSMPAAHALAADAPGPCQAGEAPANGDCRPVEEIAAAIRAIVEKGVGTFDLTAALVKVRIGDVEIMNEAYGTSMTGVPATTAMHFRNGAVAIAYMSTVLLRMQEEGLLSVDDTLSTWFPDYPKADEITLHMLITSTSGYADYVNLDYLPLYEDPFRQFTPDELIAIAFGRDMVCDPGTCFAYAHTNFVILGEVMSKVAGKPLEELIARYVLEPLDLHNTRSEHTAVIQEPVLHAFTSERGVLEDSTYWNPSWTLARGAVMTTDIGDLLTSAIAIGSGSLLSAASHEAQLAEGADGVGRFVDKVHYAMGVFMTNGWAIQTPSFAGYAAAMAYLPEGEIGVALAATNGAGTPDEPRATDAMFAEIGAYLAPDRKPLFAR